LQDLPKGTKVFVSIWALKKKANGTYCVRVVKMIYGLCGGAMAFWKEMLKTFKAMNFVHSTADLCIYYKWTAAGFLIVWLSWIDHCACLG